MPANLIYKSVIIKFWLPVILCMGLIFFTSSIPGSNMPTLFSYQDVVFHLVAYALLAYFFSRALKNTYSELKSEKIILFAIIFVIIYSLSDEFHQFFTPYRCVSSLDVLVNTIAGFIGSIIFTCCKQKER